MKRRKSFPVRSIASLIEEGAILENQDGNHGEKHPTSKDYVDDGIPFLMASDINDDGKPDLKSCKFIPKSLGDSLRIGFAKEHDVLLTHKGSIGRVAIVPSVPDYVMLTPQVTYYRVDHSRLSNRFLCFAFRHPDFQSRMVSLSAQSTRPYIGITGQRQLQIYCPAFPTQRKIAAVLSAYDDLIENNTRRIAILEEMAQSIYREWFVNFRFPGHENVRFIESPLGKIPEGWKVGVINDVVRLLSGFAFKSQSFIEGGKYRLVTIKNVHDGRFVEELNSQLDVVPNNMPEHCHLTSGDILLSLTGNIGRTCIVYGSGFLLNQRVAKLSPLNEMDTGYVYCLFRSLDTQVRLSNIAIGVAQQNLSPVQTGQLTHLLPPRLVVDTFAETINPIFWNIVQICRKNCNLRQTRDLLLPKLISGELDVEDLDIETGENAVADASGSDLVCSEAVREGSGRSEPQASTPPRKKQS